MFKLIAGRGIELQVGGWGGHCHPHVPKRAATSQIRRFAGSFHTGEQSIANRDLLRAATIDLRREFRGCGFPERHQKSSRRNSVVGLQPPASVLVWPAEGERTFPVRKAHS